VDSPDIDRRLVLHIAKLASLSISDEQADRLAKDLAQIVGYVEQLVAVDTSEVAPSASALADRIPWRQDEVRPGLSQDDALAQAPRVESGGFAVPTFVE
jgi:aspartyl-tRNA(Asn)/glutamyl-tRNA(Gln) amidotransferase subunit C